MISFARAFAAAITLFAKNDEQRGCACGGLTAARIEYSKALRPPRRREIKFSSMHMKQQPTIFHGQKLCKTSNFMQRILLRNFSVAKQHDLLYLHGVFHR